MSQEPDPTRRHALLAMAGLPFLARMSLASTGQVVSSRATPQPQDYLRGEEILAQGRNLIGIAGDRLGKYGVSLSKAGLPLVYGTWCGVVSPLYGVTHLRIEQRNPHNDQVLRIKGTAVVDPELPDGWHESYPPKAWVLGEGTLPDGFVVTALHTPGNDVWAEFELLGNWTIDWPNDLRLPLVLGEPPESMIAWGTEDQVLRSMCWAAGRPEPEVEFWGNQAAKPLDTIS